MTMDNNISSLKDCIMECSRIFASLEGDKKREGMELLRNIFDDSLPDEDFAPAEVNMPVTNHTGLTETESLHMNEAGLLSHSEIGARIDNEIIATTEALLRTNSFTEMSNSVDPLNVKKPKRKRVTRSKKEKQSNEVPMVKRRRGRPPKAAQSKNDSQKVKKKVTEVSTFRHSDIIKQYATRSNCRIQDQSFHQPEPLIVAPENSMTEEESDIKAVINDANIQRNNVKTVKNVSHENPESKSEKPLSSLYVSDESVGHDVRKFTDKQATTNILVPSLIDDNLTNNSLQYSIQSITEGNYYLCTMCNKSFSYQRSSQLHLRQHVYVPLACIKCRNHFPNAVTMHLHTCNPSKAQQRRDHKSNKDSTNQDTYQCQICCSENQPVKFDDILDYHRHLQSLHQVDRNELKTGKYYGDQCPECDPGLSDTASTIEYNPDLQSGCCHVSLPYVCKDCSAHFNHLEELVSHRENKHSIKPTDNENFLCSVCGKLFNKRAALMRHLVSHTEQKPYKCPHCDFSCREQSNLTRHVDYHFARRRRFTCSLCGASFHAKKTLETHHTYKHTNERNFACEKCGMAFKTRNSLQRHTKTHDPVKEHKCLMCSMAFHRFYNLRRHVMMVHKLEGGEFIIPPVRKMKIVDAQSNENDSVTTEEHPNNPDNHYDNYNDNPANEAAMYNMDTNDNTTEYNDNIMNDGYPYYPYDYSQMLANTSLPIHLSTSPNSPRNYLQSSNINEFSSSTKYRAQSASPSYVQEPLFTLNGCRSSLSSDSSTKSCFDYSRSDGCLSPKQKYINQMPRNTQTPLFDANRNLMDSNTIIRNPPCVYSNYSVQWCGNSIPVEAFRAGGTAPNQQLDHATISYNVASLFYPENPLTGY